MRINNSCPAGILRCDKWPDLFWIIPKPPTVGIPQIHWVIIIFMADSWPPCSARDQCNKSHISGRLVAAPFQKFLQEPGEKHDAWCRHSALGMSHCGDFNGFKRHARKWLLFVLVVFPLLVGWCKVDSSIYFLDSTQDAQMPRLQHQVICQDLRGKTLSAPPKG